MEHGLDTTTITVVAACFVLWGLVSARLERINITAPIAFVVLGLVVSNEPVSLIDIGVHADSVRHVAELTLALVLFADASRVNLRCPALGRRGADSFAGHRSATDHGGRLCGRAARHRRRSLARGADRRCRRADRRRARRRDHARRARPCSRAEDPECRERSERRDRDAVRHVLHCRRRRRERHEFTRRRRCADRHRRWDRTRGRDRSRGSVPVPGRTRAAGGAGARSCPSGCWDWRSRRTPRPSRRVGTGSSPPSSVGWRSGASRPPRMR